MGRAQEIEEHLETGARYRRIMCQREGAYRRVVAVHIVMMMVVVWFMIIRPQQKKTKEQAELLKTLKAGDKVVTSSGILGVVTSVRDDSVTLRSADSKLEVQKSTVAQIVEKGA